MGAALELHHRQSDSLVDHLQRALRDQDDLDELCGPDPGPPPPPNAPPLTAEELITSPVPARVRP